MAAAAAATAVKLVELDGQEDEAAIEGRAFLELVSDNAFGSIPDGIGDFIKRRVGIMQAVGD